MTNYLVKKGRFIQITAAIVCQ